MVERYAPVDVVDGAAVASRVVGAVGAGNRVAGQRAVADRQRPAVVVDRAASAAANAARAVVGQDAIADRERPVVVDGAAIVWGVAVLQDNMVYCQRSPVVHAEQTEAPRAVDSVPVAEDG